MDKFFAITNPSSKELKEKESASSSSEVVSINETESDFRMQSIVCEFKDDISKHNVVGDDENNVAEDITSDVQSPCWQRV